MFLEYAFVINMFGNEENKMENFRFLENLFPLDRMVSFPEKKGKYQEIMQVAFLMGQHDFL